MREGPPQRPKDPADQVPVTLGKFMKSPAFAVHAPMIRVSPSSERAAVKELPLRAHERLRSRAPEVFTTCKGSRQSRPPAPAASPHAARGDRRRRPAPGSRRPVRPCRRPSLKCPSIRRVCPAHPPLSWADGLRGTGIRQAGPGRKHPRPCPGFLACILNNPPHRAQDSSKADRSPADGEAKTECGRPSHVRSHSPRTTRPRDRFDPHPGPGHRGFVGRNLGADCYL